VIETWLNSTERAPNPYTQFRLLDVEEPAGLPEPVRDYVSELLRESRFDSGFLTAMAGVLGWERVRDSLASGAAPGSTSTRRGDFGEVLITALLEEVHGYVVPVRKLRFKVTRDQLLTGTDALAIRINNEGRVTEVCFVESKLRTATRGEVDRTLAVTGCQQLKKDYDSKLPDILQFIAQRLYETEDELFAAFGEYMRTRADTTDLDTFCLGLVWDREEWEEQILQNLEDHTDVVPRLVVHAVRINNLGTVSDDMFARVGVLEVLDDE
jgi:hypothetical protein